MPETANLKLPYLAAAQSQKHVTHNEALRALDAVIQLGVLDRDVAAAPPSPAEGDRYIVAAGATGAWAGQSGRIAAWQDGAWAFHAPVEGWLAWVADESKLAVFDGSAWIDLPGSGGGGTNLSIANRNASTLDVASDTGLDATVPAATASLAGLMTGADKTKLDGIASGADVTPAALQSRTMVGVNATADTTNRLSVSAPAILLNHEGAGHQVKVNKSAATDTASFLFQTGFSGRAEMGTTGDDDFHFKVSADGTAWTEALKIDRTNGVVTVPVRVALDTAAYLTLLGGDPVINFDANDYVSYSRGANRFAVNIGGAERLAVTGSGVVADNINVGALTEATSIDNAADFLFLETAAGARRKVKPTNLGLGGGGGGEANTASNVNAGGVGVFKVKSGVDLQFRGLNAGSGRIAVTLDGANNEIDIDVVESALTLGNLGGSIDLGSAKASGTLAAGRFPALTGAVVTASGSLTTVLADAVVTTAKIADDAVAYAKLQNAAANTALTRAAGTAGNIGETALAASQLLGRGSTGDIAAIALGSGLTMSGTTLSASGGSPLHQGVKPYNGRYYAPMVEALGTVALTANTLYHVPVFLPDMTITEAVFYVQTAAAGTNVRLGLRNMSASGVPTTLVSGGDFGAVSSATTGKKTITGLSVTVAAGWYYLDMVSDGAPSTRGSTTNNAPPVLGFSFDSTAHSAAFLQRAFTYAALPSDETGQSQTVQNASVIMPIMGVL